MESVLKRFLSVLFDPSHRDMQCTVGFEGKPFATGCISMSICVASAAT
jgi:hypothetical protein